MNDIILYTDGACSGNPGPGGWGFVMKFGDQTFEDSGFLAHTTNNAMELTAVIEGIDALIDPQNIIVVSDSKYVCDGMRSWMHGWAKRGWKTASGKEVKNIALWKEVYRLWEKHTIKEVRWVKGHAGHSENERCDFLATQQIKLNK